MDPSSAEWARLQAKFADAATRNIDWEVLTKNIAAAQQQAIKGVDFQALAENVAAVQRQSASGFDFGTLANKINAVPQQSTPGIEKMLQGLASSIDSALLAPVWALQTDLLNNEWTSAYRSALDKAAKQFTLGTSLTAAGAAGAAVESALSAGGADYRAAGIALLDDKTFVDSTGLVLPANGRLEVSEWLDNASDEEVIETVERMAETLQPPDGLLATTDAAIGLDEDRQLGTAAVVSMTLGAAAITAIGGTVGYAHLSPEQQQLAGVAWNVFVGSVTVIGFQVGLWQQRRNR